MAEISGKIYTRVGDRGRTRLLGGETIDKDDLRVDTYGALDELQSSVGMARALVTQEDLRAMIFSIQKDLFTAGSEMASTPAALSNAKRRLTESDVSALEAKIDELAESFGLPRTFVVPGASPDSAALHVSRSVCRRVERLLVRLNRKTGSYPALVVYFNRLSDLLFVMAWAAAVCAGIEDVLGRLAPAKDSVRKSTP